MRARLLGNASVFTTHVTRYMPCVVQDELRRYDPALLSAPAIVIANKVDRCPDPRVALTRLAAATCLPIVPVAAARGLGLGRLREALRATAGPGAGQPGEPPGMGG